MVEVWEPIEKAQRAPVDARTFDPDDAPYIAEEGRGGNAALIERGFVAVSAYNEVLTRYARGESVSTIRPATDALTTNVSALALVAGLSGVAAPATAAVQGLETLAAALLAVSDRAEFARAIEANTGKVDALLAAVRAFTPDMYQAARTHALQLRLEGHAAAMQDLESFRQMLASWVLAIDDARRALAALEAAVTAQADGGVSISGVAYWTGELTAHAEAVKFAARGISDAF